MGLQTIIIAGLALQSGKSGSGNDNSASGSKKQGGVDAVEAGGDINGIFPRPSSKYIRLNSQEEIYMPNMSSARREDRMETRRRWDELMPRKLYTRILFASHPLILPMIRSN